MSEYIGIKGCVVGTAYDTLAHPPSNEIWYVPTYNQKAAINKTDKFLDAEGNVLEITSHVYADGKGVITFNGELASISGAAFMRVVNYGEIYLPSSVTALGNSVFENCTGLRLVDLGKGVASIGYGVFRGCGKLNALFVPASVPPATYNSTLSSIPADCSVYVDIVRFKEYEADNVWGKLGQRLQPCYVSDTLRVETINGVTYVMSGYGKNLYCTFNEMNYGMTATLGYVWYDKDGHELPEPHMLTIEEFIEIDHVTVN